MVRPEVRRVWLYYVSNLKPFWILRNITLCQQKARPGIVFGGQKLITDPLVAVILNPIFFIACEIIRLDATHNALKNRYTSVKPRQGTDPSSTHLIMPTAQCDRPIHDRWAEEREKKREKNRAADGQSQSRPRESLSSATCGTLTQGQLSSMTAIARAVARRRIGALISRETSTAAAVAADGTSSERWERTTRSMRSTARLYGWCRRDQDDLKKGKIGVREKILYRRCTFEEDSDRQWLNGSPSLTVAKCSSSFGHNPLQVSPVEIVICSRATESGAFPGTEICDGTKSSCLNAAPRHHYIMPLRACLWTGKYIACLGRKMAPFDTSIIQLGVEDDSMPETIVGDKDNRRERRERHEKPKK
ncbi:hypothetical protein BKA93DRAFT_752319 [Sparassis latifolia]